MLGQVCDERISLCFDQQKSEHTIVHWYLERRQEHIVRD
jgi:hypothetical protein